jgi:hypothetical protein
LNSAWHGFIKKYSLSDNNHFNLKQTLLHGVDAEARAIKKARVYKKYSLSYNKHFNLKPNHEPRELSMYALGRVKMPTRMPVIFI